MINRTQSAVPSTLFVSITTPEIRTFPLLSSVPRVWIREVLHVHVTLRFNSMLCELLDLASGIQRTSQVFQAHQEAMEAQVMETLQEYSGVLNTLPGLVRLHEEAMEYYNSSKSKDSVSSQLPHSQELALLGMLSS